MLISEENIYVLSEELGDTSTYELFKEILKLKDEVDNSNSPAYVKDLQCQMLENFVDIIVEVH